MKPQGAGKSVEFRLYQSSPFILSQTDRGNIGKKIWLIAPTAPLWLARGNGKSPALLFGFTPFLPRLRRALGLGAKGWHCSLSNFQWVWGLGWFVHSRVNVCLIQLKCPLLAISNLSWWPGKIHCKWLGMAITPRLMCLGWLGQSCHQHLVLTILVQSSIFLWFPSQSSLWKAVLWQAGLWSTLLVLPWQMQFGFELCLILTEPYLVRVNAGQYSLWDSWRNVTSSPLSAFKLCTAGGRKQACVHYALRSINNRHEGICHIFLLYFGGL